MGSLKKLVLLFGALDRKLLDMNTHIPNVKELPSLGNFLPAVQAVIKSLDS